MRKLILTTLGLALLTPLAVRAQSMTLPQTPATNAQRPALPDEVLEVRHERPFAGGIVIRDTFGGAVLGAAAGGGYALYQKENNNNGDWGNWQRPVLIGAGVGAGVGLILGIVDATTWSGGGYYDDRPVADQRSTGFTPATAQYGLHF
jgi:hypothetical protein